MLSFTHMTLSLSTELLPSIKLQRFPHLLSLSSSIIILMSLLLLSPCFAKDIVVVVSDDIPVYQRTLQGVRTGLLPSFHLQEYILGQSLHEDQALGEQIRASNPDLVLTIGRKATLLAKREIVDQPIVFCDVLNHTIDNLPTSNMTGVSMMISSRKQLESIKTIFPHIQRVGLLYDETRLTDVVQQAHIAAKEVGLALIALPVAHKDNVPPTLRQLLSQIEVLWLLRDPLVVNSESLSFVMQTALEKHIPVFGFSSGLMRHGALASLSLDYQRMGEQAARLSRTILRQSLSLKHLPLPQSPAQPQLTLNLNAAEFFDITLSEQSLKIASQLFGGAGAFAKNHDLQNSMSLN